MAELLNSTAEDDAASSREDFFYPKRGSPKSAAAKPADRVNMRRLSDSITASEKRMKVFRTQHKEAVDLFAGSRYGEGKSREKTTINLLRLAIETWRRRLVTRDPQALVLTRGLNEKVDAFELEIAVNHLVKAIELGKTLVDVAQSAFFSLGVMKIGLTDNYLATRAGFSSATGHPYAEHILFEDFLLDLTARSWREVAWIGNAYRVPLADVLKNSDFDAEARKRLESLEDTPLKRRDENTNSSSGGGKLSMEDSDYRRQTELVDIYLPDDRLLVTMGGRAATRPLLVKEWTGHEKGPYHLLYYSVVPGNLIPAAPAQSLVDMQTLITTMFAQLSRQALRSKTITLANGRAVADGSAERVANSIDGGVYHVGDTENMKQLTFEGANQENLRLVGLLKEWFSYIAGNLDTAAGLAPSSRTIGQEEMLSETSSEMLDDMADQVVEFTATVIEALGEMLYSDPTLQLHLSKELPGLGNVPFTWTSRQRSADVFGFNFKVQPYSMTRKTPSQRIQTITDIITRFILPMEQQMSQSGQRLDTAKLVELLSKYSDLPELLDIIQSDTTRPGEQTLRTPVARRPLQAAETTRNYVTQSTPGGSTKPAEEAVMATTGGG